MKIAVLALDGAFDTGLSTVLDAFTTANELAAWHGLDAPPFETQVVGTRARVASAQGLRIPVQALASCPRRIGSSCRHWAARCPSHC
jgi:hypothetical protein